MSASHPGGKRWHGRRFFPQLSGLQAALDHIRDATPTTSGGKPSPSDVEERRAKQAAKLARRAKRAGHPE